MKNIVKVIGQIPAALLFWPFYILPLLLFKQIKLVKSHSVGTSNLKVFEFELSDKDTFYTKKWKNWTGNSGPFYFIKISTSRMLKRRPYLLPDRIQQETKRLITHELQHNIQQFRYGPMFFPVYLIESAKKGYTDNKFEIEARIVSGEQQ